MAAGRAQTTSTMFYRSPRESAFHNALVTRAISAACSRPGKGATRTRRPSTTWLEERDGRECPGHNLNDARMLSTGVPYYTSRDQSLPTASATRVRHLPRLGGRPTTATSTTSPAATSSRAFVCLSGDGGGRTGKKWPRDGGGGGRGERPRGRGPPRCEERPTFHRVASVSSVSASMMALRSALRRRMRSRLRSRLRGYGRECPGHNLKEGGMLGYCSYHERDRTSSRLDLLNHRGTDSPNMRRSPGN